MQLTNIGIGIGRELFVKIGICPKKSYRCIPITYYLTVIVIQVFTQINFFYKCKNKNKQIMASTIHASSPIRHFFASCVFPWNRTHNRNSLSIELYNYFPISFEIQHYWFAARYSVGFLLSFKEPSLFLKTFSFYLLSWQQYWCCSFLWVSHSFVSALTFCC